MRVGLNGVRPLGSEAIHIALWMDGRRVKTIDFDPTGSAAFDLDRQEFSGRTQECRLPVTAGDHWIAATLADLYDGLPPSYHGPNPSAKVIPPAGVQGPPRSAARTGCPLSEAVRGSSKGSRAHQRCSHQRAGSWRPLQPADGAIRRKPAQIFVCGHLHGGHDAACTQKILTHLARRAFRRPPTAHEIERLTSLVALAQKNGDSYDEGICLAVQSVLISRTSCTVSKAIPERRQRKRRIV